MVLAKSTGGERSHAITPRTAGYDYSAKRGIAPAGLPPASTAARLAALPPVGPILT